MLATLLNFILLISTIASILLKASQSWGFSQQQAIHLTLQEKASEQKIWQDPQWLKLNHYEKSFFGNYSSPFTQGLFLHPQGDTSPKDELLKTIEVLYGPQNKNLGDNHPQCRYLARTAWLNKTLSVPAELKMPCPQITSWKSQLNAKSIAIIFAAADLGNASSSYGHTFLKAINPQNAKNKDLIDYGINYAANADSSEGVFYALKGLFGLYNGQFTMLPYHQKIREYINLEGRDIWEYHLNFTAEEVDFLVNHLIEMEPARSPYYFFSDNCSYQILKTLEAVRPNLNLSEEFKYFVIPIDTVKKIVTHKNLISRVEYKKALKTDYLENYAQLNLLEKKALSEVIKSFKIPADYELSNKEKAQVYETAMKHYAVKAFTTNKDYEDEKYNLYLERVTLGQIDTFSKTKKALPPESSHDSSAIYIGGGVINQQNNNIHYSSLKFRNAYHDIEQQDHGTVPFSHNEMASIEVRNYNDHLEIANLRLLKLINLNPVTQLDNNFSWRVTADIQNKWRHNIELGAGYSFDYNVLERTRVGYFIAAKTYSDYTEDNELIYLNGAGPNLFVVTRFSENLGASADLFYWSFDRQTPFLKGRLKMNYTLKNNFDIQIQTENHYNKSYETQLNFVFNFIL